MLSHDRIWAAIDALAKSHSLSASGLARKAGLDPTSFNKSKRFTGEGEHPRQLDAILFEDFTGLRQAREAEDARIIAWVRSLDEAAIEGEFTFTMITLPDTITQKLAPCVSHFFNHQTHHRGQAHTILSLLGEAPPPLDLIYFTRTDEGQALC